MPITSTLLLGVIGLFAGMLSGVFGIGGGIVIVPALIYLAGFRPHVAIGTSLAVLLPPVGAAAALEPARFQDADDIGPPADGQQRSDAAAMVGVTLGR